MIGIVIGKLLPRARREMNTPNLVDSRTMLNRSFTNCEVVWHHDCGTYARFSGLRPDAYDQFVILRLF
jgi:hypothetical protein